MTNNKLLCCLTIGILFVLIIMIGNKVFKNKKIIEENFYEGETTQDDLKVQLETIQQQIDAITTKNQEQDTALTEKQNKLTDDQESKLKLFETLDFKDLRLFNWDLNGFTKTDSEKYIIKNKIFNIYIPLILLEKITNF